MKIIILISLIISTNLFAKDCNNNLKKLIAKKDSPISSCKLIKGLEANLNQEYVFIVRNENKGKNARGVGIEIYLNDSVFKNPLFEDFGLGQAIGTFYHEDKELTFLISDFDKNGVPEFGVNVLNERTALFFMYSYDKSLVKFVPLKFNRTVEKKKESIDRLISSLNYPVKISSKKIQVYFDEKRHVTYHFKDGAFYQN
jgi:hypothetical protein